MFLYFFFIRIAALFGHQKARLLVRGQRQTLKNTTPVTGAVWIHAASVGEFEQARPLIERLRREQPNRKILLSFFSPSGYELRRNYDQVDQVVYMPFATRRRVKKFLDLFQPEMALFVKYEFWPAYLQELKRRNIPTYSISAIFRPKQRFFLPWGKSQLRLLHCFTHIYVQDDSSLQLLQRYGVNHCSVTGDTRFDRVGEILNRHKSVPVVERFVEGCNRIIVAGSTWPQDEALLAQYMHEQWENGEGRNTRLILVPHETDESHLDQIFQLFKGRLLRYSVLTQGQNIKWAGSQETLPLYPNVLLIDTIGLLSSIYPYAQVAYIGGGFGAGIHNTIEAAVYGKPVVFGPNYSHFREAKGLITAQAARSVNDFNELRIALDNALEHSAEIGAKAGAYVESEIGATGKIFADLFEK